jgi:Adenosyl cobinamide kinase/adenosyl cobinamide phosphate guanylyltransferase
MMILLTGGSGCGKSAYAERILKSAPMPRYYLAAMRPMGPEGEAKVERHRSLREGKGFKTIERYTDYAALELPERGAVLLEGVMNLTANEMFDEQGNMRDPFDAVISGIDALSAQCDMLVIVTGDVGSEGNRYDPSTYAYVSALGQINAAIALRADTVIEMVAGIPLAVKGELPV